MEHHWGIRSKVVGRQASNMFWKDERQIEPSPQMLSPEFR